MMSSLSALSGLRIGCVQYLNAKPLIEGYSGPVKMDHPSSLARDMASEALDAALVPVFAALGARSYLLVDDVAISSDGPVYSVFLAHRKPVRDLRAISLDPASLTSVHLLKVLLAEYYQQPCEFLDEASGADSDGRLLIGNQAIDFRRAAPVGWEYLDLGEEWQRQTGLPFVYALWLLSPSLAEPKAVADSFRALKQWGKEHLEEIIGKVSGDDEAFSREYLSHHIRFDLGAREKAGLALYQQLLIRHGFVQPSGETLQFL